MPPLRFDIKATKIKLNMSLLTLIKVRGEGAENLFIKAQKYRPGSKFKK